MIINHKPKCITGNTHVWDHWQLESITIWWIVQKRKCKVCGFTEIVKESLELKEKEGE
jgi:hypothetical protein